MDGRKWTACVLTGVVAAVAGCSNTPKTASGMTAQLPGQGESRWARLFGPKPPGPVNMPVEVVDGSRKNKPISNDTHVAFAKTQMGAAFLEGQDRSDELVDAARQRFQAVLQKEPTNAEAMRGLAELYTRARDRDRALKAYEQLVHAHPKDHKAAYEMALACASFDEWASAVGAVEYALSLDPENRSYLKTYGKCLAWAGQADRAFESLVKVMPEAEARYTLAKVLVEAEHMALGRVQLELAVKADPSYSPAKDALDRMTAAPANPVVQTQFQGQPAGQ